MINLKDLPKKLFTIEGHIVHTNGLVVTAKMEARDEERIVFANYLLTIIEKKVIELCGEQHLRDWCKAYLEKYK